MVRKSMLVIAALLAALAAIPASARPEAPTPVVAQGTDDQVDATAGERLRLGERFDGSGFAFEAQDLYSVRSLLRTGYDEVRVPVTFINQGPAPLVYSTIALSGVDGYPAVQLRDSAGVVHSIDTRDPSNSAAPGSNLTVVPVGMPVHWTAGFQVPTAYTGSMELEVVDEGVIVASYTLTSNPRPLTGFSAPPGVEQVDFGDTVAWSNGVDLTFRGIDTVACGAAELVHSAVSSIVDVRVVNTDVVDQFFPAVRHPSVTGYAIWADGSSGRYVGATTIFPNIPEDATTQQTNELIAEGVRSIPNVRTSHEIVVPPGFPLDLGIVFQAPRDSRFVDVTGDPVALWLTPLDGRNIWVDLTSAPISDFEIAEESQTDVACAFGQPTLFLNTADEPQVVVTLEEEQPETEGS